MTERIIIDTDPGQDDAVALLLAFAAPERLDILGITTVAGNIELDKTTANALRVRDLAARPDVPVFRGADRPLIYPLETVEFLTGPDGLAGAGLPPPRGEIEEAHAVDFLIETLRRAKEREVTLCPLGPLTNIGLALRLAPDIAGKIRRIVLMGGALGVGNITPAAEFNIYVDPHAAAIVYDSGIPIVMMGLNLTLQAICSHVELNAIKALGTATGRSIHGMIARPRPSGLGSEAAHPMHDVCVIAYLLWPELFAGRDCFVEVEVGAGSQRGRTTVDWNGRLKKPANALVMDKVDAPEMFRRLTGAVACLP